MKLLLIAILIGVLAFFGYLFFKERNNTELAQMQQECEETGGIWNGNTQECELNILDDDVQPVSQTDQRVAIVEENIDTLAVTVPDMDDVVVPLDEVSPRNDFAMGDFESDDGVVRGTVVALEDYITFVNGDQYLMPFAVNSGGSGEFVYLGLFMAEVSYDDTVQLVHQDSTSLGDRIDMQSIETIPDRPNWANVFYLEHGADQAMAEAPNEQVQLQVEIDATSFVSVGEVAIDFEGEVGDSALSLSCEEAGGTWLPEYGECEYIGADWCTQQGGVFDECASACRHNPNAEICTMQCVPVCSDVL